MGVWTRSEGGLEGLGKGGEISGGGGVGEKGEGWRVEGEGGGRGRRLKSVWGCFKMSLKTFETCELWGFEGIFEFKRGTKEPEAECV